MSHIPPAVITGVAIIALSLTAAAGIIALPHHACDRMPLARFAGSDSNATTEETLHIPVIFHIVYRDESQNLEDARVLSQLAVINEDYNKNNSNLSEVVAAFRALATSVDVRFYLQGITRTATAHGPFVNDDLHLTSRGGRDAVDPQRFLNVWVANLGSGAFGYASALGGEEFNDGIAIHYQYFGRGGRAISPYDQGRTLTHEIGHWLGLQHPWGNGGCDSDDGLSDTPPQDTAPSGCPLTKKSCGSLDMVQNFMNTSADNCLALFTPQQRERMRATLFHDRPGVYRLSSTVTDVNEGTKPYLFTVYPNPITNKAEAKITLPHDGSVRQLQLLTIQGTPVRTYTIPDRHGEISIDLSGLENGLYIAQANGHTTKIQLNIQQ